MASVTFALEVANKSLRDDGFFDLSDSSIGEHISEMEQKAFPFFSQYGLDFCKQYVLDDARIRSILESIFKRCSLGHWLRYKAYPGHIECFRRGGPKAGLRVLVVQLWAKGSRAVYYLGSHLLDLPTEKGQRSLHEISRRALVEAGCEAKEVKFPEGGVVILDARICFEMEQGYAITFMFATDEVLKAWPKMILPNSRMLIANVANMESPKIGVNFAFDSPAGNTNT